MPNLYAAALMLVRVFAGMNITIGIASLTTIVFVVVLEILTRIEAPWLEGILGYLAAYGMAALVGGISLLILSKKIARYASKG
jgi:hypothetical protein